VVSFSSYAQVQYLGNYSRHTIFPSKIRFFVQENVIEIKILSDDIIKVNFFPDSLNLQEDSSFSIIYTGIAADYAFIDYGTYFKIETDSLIITTSKFPFRISYFDKSQKLLLKERSTGGIAKNLTSTEKYSYFDVQPSDHYYGLGQKGTALDRKGFSFDTYNRHIGGYSSPLTTMQINIPFLSSPLGYGVFFDITYPGYFDLGSSNQNEWFYKTENGQFNYYFVYGSSLKEILKKYFLLTGMPPLPPKWALGFIQSKYGYQSEYEARSIVNNFEQKNIPIDAIVLDLYWFGWGKMGNLTWDFSNWINPTQMISDFKQKGIKTILISEPYINVTSSNWSYANSNGYFAKQNNSSYIFDPFWATPSSLIDFTLPAAQNWWWNKYKPLINQGVEGLWTDLGEPENHPDFLQHHFGTARKIHNIYNLLWAKNLFDGYATEYSNKRIFNLTRSGFAGIQRFGVCSWSGDVGKSFGGLKVQVPMLQGMVMSGLPYFNSDIGGFTNGTTSEELYTRWIQFGTFNPAMRPHSAGQSVEPWVFGETTEAIVKKFIELRYMLVPYIYSYIYKNYLFGETLIKPLIYEYPNFIGNPELDSKFLFGDNFLIAPITQQGQTTASVFIPNKQNEKWADYWTDNIFLGGQSANVLAPIDRIPVFIKVPSITPIMKRKKWITQSPDDTLMVKVYPGAYTAFDLFEDDGETTSYLCGGFTKTKLECELANSKISVIINPIQGSYAGMLANRVWIVDVHLIKNFDSVIVNGIVFNLAYDSISFINSNNSYWYNSITKILYTKFFYSTSVITELTIKGVSLTSLKDNHVLPSALQLSQNYPNPFNPSTKIKYEIQNSGYVSLKVFDILGNELETLVDEDKLPGVYEVEFNINAKKDNKCLTSGVYFYQLKTCNHVETKRMILLK
jgi:alpha-glucosidase (family GH31 glycosyl hydrolase)